ncbi:MAG: GNAT family N-acetyltransferase [Nitriliruptorales bacterium]|nr:GNAT family N-acetyltransferase [Nitriliruptorales bacterium]
MLAGLRPMAAEDVEAMIGLVDAAFREYPGCILDLEGFDADLPELPARLRAAGGDGWVVEDAGRVVAMVGWAPVDAVTGELKRLYVDLAVRRRGIGAALIELVVDAVRSSGRERVELFSDSRFEDAHRLYERSGFIRQPETRELHDPSNTTEMHFVRDLRGVSPRA